MVRTNPRAAVRRSIPLLLCLALALLLLIPAAAADGTPETPSMDPHNYVDRNTAVIYNNANGLPSSDANDIVQTSEGFIWIGSYSGLIRYDGKTFERMDSTTGLASVESLFVDSQDRLWIGTNDNGLALLVKDELRFWDEDDGFASTKIGSIQEDSDGSVYVGTTAGIMKITPDMQAHAIDDPKIANAYIETISLGSDGLLYGITNEDDFFVLRHGKLEKFIDHTETRIPGITCILADPDEPGALYFGTDGGKLYHGKLKDDVSAMQCWDASPLVDVIDIEKFGDQVWITSSNGIGVADGDGFHCLSELPMNSAVYSVTMDYEGNLWFASGRQGVMKVVPNRFINILPRFELDPRVVNTTCFYEGHLFIGSDDGLIVINKSERVNELPLTEAKTASGEDLGETDLIRLLDGVRIRSILRDSAGNLWISTWRGCGLLRYDGASVTAFTVEDGLPSNQLRAVAEREDGSIIAAVTGGVSVIEGDRVTRIYDKDDGIENLETLTVCAAPNGDIVVGSNGGGIYIINEDGVRCLGKKDGLASAIIMRVKYDPDEHVYWLVTSNSIGYMTEDYKITTIKKFPYSNNFDLYKNSKDEMWILSSNGIHIVPTEQLLANGGIDPVHYGLSNGLPFTSTSNSYSELMPDGSLYIAGTKGVVRVNIEDPLEDVRNLKQAVPFIEVDGTNIYPDAKGNYTIPRGARKITVYPFVFNYSLTDPQVSYRLEGFDREATVLNRKELGPVTYTNLPGGEYRFVMEVTDALGRESSALSVQIVKEKELYEYAWLYVVLCVIAVAALQYIVKSRVERRMLALEEAHREEAERERLIGELQMANRIQSSMLPHDFPPFPERTEFDLYAVMNPAREVGGDFYDYYLIDEDHLGLVIADVSGKGIPAALFMMVSKSMIKSFASVTTSPAAILSKVNDMICTNNRLDMFVTVWVGILQLSTGKLVAANAGHEYPVLKRADGRFELIKDRHGLVIGGMSGVPYTQYELQLAPGDKLFLHTDGVTEAGDSEHHMFGKERMLEALNTEPEASPEKLLKNVRQAVDAFVQDAEQFDDLTMLCVEYKGSRPDPNETP